MASINDDNFDFFLTNFRNYISLNFQEESKDKLLKYLQEVDIKKLINLINYISKYLPSLECIPKHIVQFREKSTVFAESIHEYGNSFILPPRKIFPFFFYQNYRSCGNIFSSIFLPKYKQSFIDIIAKL